MSLTHFRSIMWPQHARRSPCRNACGTRCHLVSPLNTAEMFYFKGWSRVIRLTLLVIKVSWQIELCQCVICVEPWLRCSLPFFFFWKARFTPLRGGWWWNVDSYSDWFIFFSPVGLRHISNFSHVAGHLLMWIAWGYSQELWDVSANNFTWSRFKVGLGDGSDKS